MDDRRPVKLNEQISEEAAAWFVEFRTEQPGEEQRRAFDAWVRASPEHLRAFLEIAMVWNDSEAIDEGQRIDVQQLLAANGSSDNVIALTRAPGEGATRSEIPAAPPSSRLRRVAWPALATAAAAGIIGAAMLMWAPWSAPGLYSTTVGERRSLTLTDGTSVTLDARSRLRVAFSASNRTVELLEGQALFQIAKDPARPFAVVAGSTLVRDIGTQFDVNRNLNGTTVTVVVGRVAVYADASAPAGSVSAELKVAEAADAVSKGASVEPILVSAGEQLRVISGDSHAQPVAVDSGSATAWRRGQIVLNASTLADVVEEFNRYSARHLVAEDHGASPLRLSGVFGIDPEFLIRYLRDRPDITVREADGEIQIIRTATR
jgi:transmembrane sensor